MGELLAQLLENPESLTILIKTYIEKYKPIVYDFAKEMLEIYKDYANNNELAITTAKVKKNIYDAYISVGFNEDQALALMINDNIQLIKNISKISNSTKKSVNNNK